MWPMAGTYRLIIKTFLWKEGVTREERLRGTALFEGGSLLGCCADDLPDDGRGKNLRNINQFLRNYTAKDPRRPSSRLMAYFLYEIKLNSTTFSIIRAQLVALRPMYRYSRQTPHSRCVYELDMDCGPWRKRGINCAGLRGILRTEASEVPLLAPR